MGSADRFPEQFAEYIDIKEEDGKWRYKFNIDQLRKKLSWVHDFWTEREGKYDGPALFIYGTKSPFKV